MNDTKEKFYTIEVRNAAGAWERFRCYSSRYLQSIRLTASRELPASRNYRIKLGDEVVEWTERPGR